MYLEKGQHRLLAPGNVPALSAQAAEALTGAVARTFERSSFESFDRHFLIEHTWREAQTLSWRASRTEFWCVGCRRCAGSETSIRFRARVVLCTLQSGSREPLGWLAAP
eukprot:CAMPEP_0197699768 /NCGR_PEP_ID=MMETSP1338-20131121/121052_1 /TAXON_ID=43686 ORGANISM="Pelagodinium beii, Strain RCC1491" /NCGR_SAMPLE_ID=MMETSP1338 /ASSEMBLY_ACC=CAM_ASM_000754 /LENGTH=108 /DNA_ID=CAMNT_0043283293 /DNA_START=236 /DNA_END=559 /DNA_ORIENTATION=-